MDNGFEAYMIRAQARAAADAQAIRDLRWQGSQQAGEIVRQQAVMAHAGEVVAEIGSNDDVIRFGGLYPAWVPDNYAPGMVRLYNDYPYKVYQPHDSTPNPNWTPEAYPAGWIPLHGTTRETALPYRQPTAAHDMYLHAEMMVWIDGHVYECIAVNGTDRGPDVLPTAWIKLGDGTEMPGDDIPDWASWDNNPNTLYQVGDKVRYGGLVWVATVGNNHWQPGVYGWEVVADA